MPDLAGLTTQAGQGHDEKNDKGINSYFKQKIETAEIEINRKTLNLRRLEAQRNALNARGKLFEMVIGTGQQAKAVRGQCDC